MSSYIELFVRCATRNQHLVDRLQKRAMEEFGCDGVEEFNLEEAAVDELLGERSYSGGDLPDEVIFEVNQTLGSADQVSLKFFFFQGEDYQVRAQRFYEWLPNQAEFSVQAVEWAEKEQQDWDALWREHFAPIQIGQSLEIVPAWQKGEQATLTCAKQLYLYPGQGFGTGQHETTSLCLVLFEQVLNSLPTIAPRILDFGTGSGILGIAAALLTEQRAYICLYDIDENALANCQQNLEFNDLSDHPHLLIAHPHQKSELPDQCDLIFANILLNTLKDEYSFLISHLAPHGVLIVSGLLNPQVDELVNFYCEGGTLKLLDQRSSGDWSALVFQKQDH